MPQMNSTTQDQVLIFLGYPADGTLLAQERLSREYPQRALDRIQLIIQDLLSIDSQLKEARNSSMASSTSHTSLDWARHLNHLRSDGHTLLQEVANLSGLNVFYSKYQPRPRHSIQYQ